MDTIQVIADQKRRRILELIWDDERPAGEIAAHFDVTFGAISQHLRVLRNSDLVTMRRDGNRRLYRADQSELGPLRPLLEAMWADKLNSLADSAETYGS